MNEWMAGEQHCSVWAHTGDSIGTWVDVWMAGGPHLRDSIIGTWVDGLMDEWMGDEWLCR